MVATSRRFPSPLNNTDGTYVGVSAVAHVASDMTFSPDPNAVIPLVLAGARNIAAAVSKQASITRFVYTSSSAALILPKPNHERTITTKDWDNEAVEIAWAPPPYNPDRSFPVYAASKTQAEKAMWDFVEKEKPGWVLNAVLPNFNMGTVLHESQAMMSSAAACTEIYRTEEGERGPLVERLSKTFPPQWMVNVQDDARLHVAALIDPDIQGERILAFAQPFNMNDILGAMRKLYPAKTFPPDVEGMGRDLSKLDNKPGEEILKRFGRKGWTGLEESVRDNVGL